MEIQEFLKQIGVDIKKPIVLNENGTVGNMPKIVKRKESELWKNKQSATN